MSCQSCRTRHYRCDNKWPECGRCRRAGRACIRGPRVRISQFSSGVRFQGDQVWLPLPRRVDFVDETKSVVEEYCGDSPLKEASVTLSPPAFISKSLSLPSAHHVVPYTESDETPSGASIVSPDVSIEIRSMEVQGSPDILTEPQSPSKRFLPQSVPRQSYPAYDTTTASLSNLLLPTIFSPTWPVDTLQEAHLIRHFVDKISCFFDFCDPKRHFAVDVPQRARQSRTLASAIYALSARHLSRVTDFDPFVADHYYQECLRTLIPALADNEAIMEDALLAAIVILRLLEEMDVPFVGSDQQGHLIGTQAIIRAQEMSAHTSSLQQAARWAAFRQEIYICLTCQRPVQLSVSLSLDDVGLSIADDAAWSLKAIVHCKDVLQFAFGPEAGSPAQYSDLLETNSRWYTDKPASFEPYYISKDIMDGGFPDIRLHSDWHVMGLQYNILAHILLVIYNPNIPRMGPSHKQAVKEQQARDDVRTLCGISLSNEHTPPAILVACMAISICGDRFTAFEEQKKLEDILIRTEQLRGWPTATVQEQLKDTWGWKVVPSLSRHIAVVS